MTRPAPAPPPADLVAGAPDPARAAIAAAAAAFADRGAGLLNRPDAAAQAAAQLEYATEAFATDPRWSAMPEGIRREMLLARSELRDAIGLDEAAPSRVAVGGLARRGAGAARGRPQARRRRPPRAAVPPGRGGLDHPPGRPRAAAAGGERHGAGADRGGAARRRRGRLSSTQMRERSAGIGGVGLAREPAGY